MVAVEKVDQTSGQQHDVESFREGTVQRCNPSWEHLFRNLKTMIHVINQRLLPRGLDELRQISCVYCLLFWALH